MIKWQRLRCCHFFCRGCSISRSPFLFTLNGLFTVDLHNLGRFSAHFLWENVLLKVRFLAFRVQNSIKSPFSGQKSMVLMPFKDNTIIQEIRDNSHVFSMLSIFSSLQSHYTILILRCDWFAALAWFRLKNACFW